MSKQPRSGQFPRVPRWPRRGELRARADARRAARAMRTDLEQIQKLERAGHGHCREIERLRKRMEKEG
jgi:hypothetical protein